eukprot:COSAG06_NODE_7243_length_2573_cov_15.697251_4_plen_139_part_01
MRTQKRPDRVSFASWALSAPAAYVAMAGTAVLGGGRGRERERLQARAGGGTVNRARWSGAMTSAKTLADVAALARIPEAELSLYDAADFDELLKELGMPVTVRVRLKKQHRDLLSGQAHGNAQQKFDAFLCRVGGADAL